MDSQEDAPPSDKPGRGVSFLDLPAEIRNQIYKDTLIFDFTIAIEAYKPYLRDTALLFTSKQIRAEALPIYYGANTFEPTGVNTFERLLREFNPDKQALIRDIHVLGNEDVGAIMAYLKSEDVLAEWLHSDDEVSFHFYFHMRLKSQMREFAQDILDADIGGTVRTSAMRLPLFSANEDDGWDMRWLSIEEYDRLEVKETGDRVVAVEIGDEEGT